MDCYLPAGLIARYFQPRVGLGSSFARSGLYSAGPVTHFQLGDQPEQCGIVQCQIVREPLRSPLQPQLHGVFEAEFARVYAGIERCLRHEHAKTGARHHVYASDFPGILVLKDAGTEIPRTCVLRVKGLNAP